MTLMTPYHRLLIKEDFKSLQAVAVVRKVFLLHHDTHISSPPSTLEVAIRSPGLTMSMVTVTRSTTESSASHVDARTR